MRRRPKPEENSRLPVQRQGDSILTGAGVTAAVEIKPLGKAKAVYGVGSDKGGCTGGGAALAGDGVGCDQRKRSPVCKQIELNCICA